MQRSLKCLPDVFGCNSLGPIQIVHGAGLISELMNSASGIEFLVTSRTLLNLRGEYEYFVPTLNLPELDQITDPVQVRQSEAFQLFIERATASAPQLIIDDETALKIARICHQLDGLPQQSSWPRLGSNCFRLNRSWNACRPASIC